jgi:hypothetical protein
MSYAGIFSDKTMGSTSAIPDKKLLRVYKLEYWIFRDLFKLTFDEEKNR